MLVSELYAPHGPFVGDDIYIIGTGPSMDLFPIQILEDKTCLLLNDAHRHFPSLKPIAFANNRNCLDGCKLPYQVVKGRLKFEKGAERTDNHCAWNDPRYYVFSYREPPWDSVSHHDERQIFAEPNFYYAPERGSISAFSVQFALLAGARAIYLVGCDCNEINGTKYVDGKTGAEMRRNYEAYQRGLLTMRRHAEKRGVPMVSVQPFFGLGWHEHQYREIVSGH